MSANTTRLLLVEDDPNLGSLLKDYLEAKGYESKLASNGKEGYSEFSKEKFDLCILDVMMPVMDGITLAKEIRKSDKNIPIVFLTAKSMKEDTIEGFRAGADDYITKPFSMDELMMRIQAILRRTSLQAAPKPEKTQFTVGLFKFDHLRQVLSINGKEQKLTTREADLLKLLCMHENEVLDRNFTLKTLWNDDSYFNARSMDVYITKLRKFLKDDPRVEILNIHGKGFRLLVNKSI
ncbi:MAG: response regulator transcription factor [Bacteroidia bacterium]|nr:response regulator transcription factor [Bacteroidia bacterium]